MRGRTGIFLFGLFTGVMTGRVAWGCGVCDYCAGDPSFIQADRRAQWLVAARGRGEAGDAAGRVAASAKRTGPERPVSLDWGAALKFRAELSGSRSSRSSNNNKDATLSTAEKYLLELEGKLEVLRDRSASRETPAYELETATLTEHACFLSGWLSEASPGTLSVLRARCLLVLAQYEQDGKPETLASRLKEYAAAAKGWKAEEAAARVLLNEAGRAAWGAGVREVLAGTVVNELAGTAAEAEARVLLARILESDGRAAAARVQYEEVLKGHAWSEWGPRAAVALGSMEVKRGGVEGAGELRKLAALYRPEELRKHESGLSRQTQAEARDAAAWAQYHAGTVLLQSGKKAEALELFWRTVELYPETGYAKAARSVSERMMP